MSTNELKIARVSAPYGQVIVDTLEIYHVDFPAPVRITNQQNTFTCTLEATAPNDPSGTVNFEPAGFNLTLPRTGVDGIQAIKIELGNIDKVVGEHLEIAADSVDPVKIIYRPYLSDDTTKPQIDPPPQLTLYKAVSKALTVVAEARTQDWINQKIHQGIRYDVDTFPALRQ